MNRFFLYFCVTFIFATQLNAQQFNGKYYFPQVYFDSVDAINRLQLGNSTISGVSFAREGNILNGVKHNAKYQTVLLFPYTEYFEEWYNLKYDNPKANIIMLPQAFSQRLETKTDEYGNFSFKKMKPGKYYLECSINYSGTAVGQQRVGTSTYYYGYSSYSSPIYQSYYYNYNAVQRANKIVEITKDGQLIEVKLKPNPFEKFKSGKPSSTDCYLINNKQFGKCKEYNPSGQLMTFAEWENGLLDGPCKFYYKTGEIQANGKFKKGFKTGLWQYYDSTNSLTSEENFVYRDKMSNLEGDTKFYYKNGKLKSIYKYKGGKIEGESLDYYESGKTKGKYVYKNGLSEGEAIEYYENGKVKVKKNLVNNKLDGLCTYFTENGNVQKKVVYKMGQVVSEEVLIP